MNKYVYYESDNVTLLHGDCREVLASFDPESIDTVITDPPYGLEFMGKGWDKGVPGIEFWEAIKRVSKPGAMLMSFGGTRTFHRMTCAIEDAGWEIRDCLMWLFGSGFPKSLDISKAIDMKACYEELHSRLERKPTRGEFKEAWRNFRKILSSRIAPNSFDDNGDGGGGWKAQKINITAPATPEAELWNGWGSALKPAIEYILLAQKPLKNNGEHDIIVENLLRLEAQLCLLLPASFVEENLKLSQKDYAEVLSDFAQWNAGEKQRIKADLLGQMDTQQLVSTVNTCLNTVILWRGILADFLTDMSTSIIETEINRIIDWKTLNSFVSALTPHSIIRAEIKAPGSMLNALPAARYLNAAVTSIVGIRTLSAQGHAMSKERILPQADPESFLKPDWLPIILAMKPLDGTFAQNALKHGVAGLNIAEGRIGLMTEAEISRSGKSTKGIFMEGGQDWKRSNKLPRGRFPANLLLDEESASLLDEQSGDIRSPKPYKYCGIPESERTIYGKGLGWNDIGHDKEFGDSGGASRFFKIVANSCPLCYNTLSKDNNKEDLWNTSANNVERNSRRLQVAEENIAQQNVWVRDIQKLVRNVKSAGNLCDLCATNIAHALVEIKFSDFNPGQLRAILDYMPSFKKNILIQSLAQFAEIWGNTDIIPTIENLSLLFGFVHHAITNYTPRTEKSGHARFIYQPKADNKDRGNQDAVDMPLFNTQIPAVKNTHPTVKPTELIQKLILLKRYLAKLTSTPTGGVILDPFAGTCTTAIAALRAGRKCICIDDDEEHLKIAVDRLKQEVLL